MPLLNLTNFTVYAFINSSSRESHLSDSSLHQNEPYLGRVQIANNPSAFVFPSLLWHSIQPLKSINIVFNNICVASLLLSLSFSFF